MAIPEVEQAYTNVNGIQCLVITTKVWNVQVKWSDQSTYWVPLHLINESNPIEVAEHAMSNGYSNEPSFRWWVRKVLKKHDRLVKKANQGVEIIDSSLG